MLIDFSKLENTGIKKPTYKKKKSAKNIAKSDNQMTSKDIVRALRMLFINHKYLINNGLPIISHLCPLKLGGFGWVRVPMQRPTNP
jgi:hypothetical protein